MIKLMLVDDNRMALEYFSQLLPWEAYGYELAATAIDGESAFIKFMEIHPDVVITDVQMPNMDGIELTRRIRQVSPHTIVLFLSSYEDFTYLRKGMRLGVCDYILKHETKAKELGDKLLSIARSLEDQRREHHFIDEGNLSSLLNSPEIPSHTEDTRRPVSYFPLKYDLTIIFQDRFLPVIRQNLHMEETEIPENQIQAFFYNYPETKALIQLQPFVFLKLSAASDLAISSAYQQKDDFYQHYQRSISIFFVAQACPIIHCLDRLKKLQSQFSQKYFFPPSTVLYPDSFMHTEAPSGLGRLPAISTPTTSKEADKICCKMDEDYLRILGSRNYSDFEVFANSYLQALLPLHQKLFDPRDHMLFLVYQETDRSFWYDVPSVFRWLKQRYSHLSHLLSDSRHKTYSPLVQEAVCSIYLNYGNSEMSAEIIADSLGTTVNRLNDAMKKETDCTIWKMLTQIRMEKAAQLLKHSDLRISEIAEQVGYKAMSHFSNTFKKYYQVTAQEYRKEKTAET